MTRSEFQKYNKTWKKLMQVKKAKAVKKGKKKGGKFSKMADNLKPSHAQINLRINEIEEEKRQQQSLEQVKIESSEVKAINSAMNAKIGKLKEVIHNWDSIVKFKKIE